MWPYIRVIVLVSSLCSLTACESTRQCNPGSTHSVLDMVLIVGALVCTGVTAAGSESEDATKRDQLTQIQLASLSTEELTSRAQQDDPAAQYALAWRSPIPEPRRYWFCRAAATEHVLQHDALFFLGEIDQAGAPVTAYSYYLLAKAKGNKTAALRLQETGRTLSASQLQAAETMVAEWKPGNCGDMPKAAQG